MTKGKAPWIGVPAQMDPGSERQYLSSKYPEAIAAVGGLPVTVPLLAEAGYIRPLAENLDGILLPGNDSDVDPALYGASRLVTCGPPQPLRERMDFFLLETAMRREIPVLAICFGVQSLNVFMGGSLIQDLPSEVGGSIRHSKPDTEEVSNHRIRISAGSILEDIVGGLDAVVNSTHHQAIDRPGSGLEVVARAPDGVVESVFGTSIRQWILGVQWHPEKSFGCDSFSQKLFENFLARCRAVRGMDEGPHT